MERSLKFLSFVMLFTTFAVVAMGEDDLSHLLKIVDCISESKDTPGCKRYRHCTRLMPKEGQQVLENCEKKNGAHTKCMAEHKMYESPAVAKNVYECLDQNGPQLDNAGRKKMRHYGKCAQRVHKRCKLPQYQ